MSSLKEPLILCIHPVLLFILHSLARHLITKWIVNDGWLGNVISKNANLCMISSKKKLTSLFFIKFRKLLTLIAIIDKLTTVQEKNNVYTNMTLIRNTNLSRVRLKINSLDIRSFHFKSSLIIKYRQ